MRALLIEAENRDTENFNTRSVQLACEYYQIRLEFLTTTDEPDYDLFEVIFIDQHSFNYQGVTKALSLVKKYPKKKVFLMKEQTLEREIRAELSAVGVRTITKPLIPYALIRRMKGVLSNE